MRLGTNSDTTPSTIMHPNLYGLDASALIEFESLLLQKDAARAFSAMRTSAKNAGIEIAICSAYRSFDKQLSIWNAKASGKRQLLDLQHQPIDFSSLSSEETIDAILLWSALPGASRHHWGTDIDVYDPSNINRDNLQLVAKEYQAGGPCHDLYLWLQQNAAQFGFYFPFQHGKSGVSPEEWHLSYFPISRGYTSLFSGSDLAKVLDNADFELKLSTLSQLDKLVSHYVKFVAPPPFND
ncbi:M15 family metallopeptidase [Shewanella aestuarii]|uniref:M15 family metallopeptidase n=2 Tax=Shewanella aestuarii TaxID=1028752 RepID=A0ABT0KWS7_9GAMM|nr:M15 family metallopeptidase [Shewanella aestuarii]MCL1115896.1 M15 family metallopeptidase [Shewanella aestuarii]